MIFIIYKITQDIMIITSNKFDQENHAKLAIKKFNKQKFI